jgi:hypothetical protein
MHRTLRISALAAILVLSIFTGARPGELDLRDSLDDPGYEQLDPWHSSDYTDYDDDTKESTE